MDFTIGYLSWKKHTILEKTLSSHKDNGLLDIIPKENRIIFFQEISDNDKMIAEKYQCNYFGDDQNIGILNAYIKLVEKCKTKYFIFCENDFILLNKDYDLKKTFDDIRKILSLDEFGQVKLSNYKNPGFLYVKGGDEWLKSNQDNFKYKIESLSWIPNVKTFYKNTNIKKYNYEWFVFNHIDQRWSNHINCSNINFLKNILVPLLNHNKEFNHKLDVKYQGLEDTINYYEDIPNQNENVKEKINILKKIKVYSGGGNFYHHKT